MQCSRFDVDDKEVTMNRFNTVRLDGIQTFPNDQFPECLYAVRGDGTG
jgi:hypothetical protein